MPNQTLITGIYLLATVFGVGVTSVELLGLLGDWGDDGGGHDGGGDNGATDGGGHGGGHDGGDVSGHNVAADSSHVVGSSHDFSHSSDNTHPAHDHARSNLPVKQSGDPILGRPGKRLFTLLWYLRLTVYFSLGFGPLGLVTILLKTSPGVSLGCASVAGLLTGLAARSFFKFQRKEFDSTITDKELLGHPATVTIAIYPGEFGRVRIQFEQLVKDRYARGEPAEATFRKGEQVIVDHIDDDCLRVRASSSTGESQQRHTFETQPKGTR